ncbi:hypothetical protein ANANG_G00094970 [Anguilla anguilla]|uniref:Uncharacterized protein n=1 Tax=Anguilla anguilla TaxID=7936 RepID=A0A9D3RYP6_ANGAN|nr:hypothetical protein ANANG_G00094970 [Anguilla anguilla]
MEIQYIAVDSIENNTVEEHSDQTRKSSDMKLMSCERSQRERRKRHISARTDKSDGNSATQRWSRWPELPAEQKPRTFRGRERADSEPRREDRRPGCVRIWEEETGGRRGPAATLPVSEEEFLRDMLSSRPRFRSRAQRKPVGYWESAAAALPAYRGPWRPGLLGAERDGGDKRSAEDASVRVAA